MTDSLAKRPVLGRALRRAATDEKRVEYLAFRLATESYAVRIQDVTEILKPPPITPVPRAQSLVLGIMSVRGRLVSVIDVRKRFSHSDSDLGRRTRILLIDVDGETIGALVDEVLQVYRLGESEIEPGSVLGVEQQPHVVGIGRPKAGRERSEILILLDLKEILRTRGPA
jgi:purine-binding chemotaxis protein CheW